MTAPLLPHRMLVVLGGLLFAVGVPMWYSAKKRWAAASLSKLLAERFRQRALPIAETRAFRGGKITFYAAYDDVAGSGLVLLLGNWSRGTILVSGAPAPVYNRV